MAIATDSEIEFFGTQDTVTAGGGTSAVTDTSFSASGDKTTWTNDDDVKTATAVLTFQYPSGTIDRGGIHLYAHVLDVDGTTESPAPSSTYKQKYLGTFPTNTGMSATTNYSVPIEIALLNTKTSQTYDFYVENQCNVTMTAGWTLKITPKTKGPHA
jgi:hypothetical protein